MKKRTLGLAMCGSFCTFSRVLDAFETLDQELYELVPIMSQASFETDSRFGPAAQFRERLETLCGREIVHTIKEAEPFGPKKLLDALVIMPCTGNTLAKLAAGIADGPVTLAAKAHLRNERPVIVAVSTNDALAGNAANLGTLLNRRGYYFVPFFDSVFGKSRNIVNGHFCIIRNFCSALVHLFGIILKFFADVKIVFSLLIYRDIFIVISVVSLNYGICLSVGNGVYLSLVTVERISVETFENIVSVFRIFRIFYICRIRKGFFPVFVINESFFYSRIFL